MISATPGQSRERLLATPRMPGESPGTSFGPEDLQGKPRDRFWRNFCWLGNVPETIFSRFRTDLFRSEALLIQPSADLSYFAQSGPSAIGLSVPWPHLAQIWPSAWTLVPITRLGAGPIFPWVKIEFLDQNSGSNLLIKFCDWIS